MLRVIVVAQDLETFHYWCRIYNENPKDPRWIWATSPDSLVGHRYSEGHPYGLLLLTGWENRVHTTPIVDEKTSNIIIMKPNDLMTALLRVFPWTWEELLSEYALIEVV